MEQLRTALGRARRYTRFRGRGVSLGSPTSPAPPSEVRPIRSSPGAMRRGRSSWTPGPSRLRSLEGSRDVENPALQEAPETAPRSGRICRFPDPCYRIPLQETSRSGVFGLPRQVSGYGGLIRRVTPLAGLSHLGGHLAPPQGVRRLLPPFASYGWSREDAGFVATLSPIERPRTTGLYLVYSTLYVGSTLRLFPEAVKPCLAGSAAWLRLRSGGYR